ncbi:MAG: gamma-butyrobetaine hydroxylase-like domain-containing protein [Polaromonas sp.]
MSETSAYPVSVVHHQTSRLLALQWSDGIQADLESNYLRSACRCAYCEKIRRSGAGPSVATNVNLVELMPIGEFGLQLRFDDGHDKGIYPWAYLRELSMAAPAEYVA